ncbi:MAG: DUF4234 domain-containing protein [Candidatus Nanohaloarchaea archaeon]|nr:DUF4234 domain-containing protein [Candidatus Nanohaloarchaea archaeon]
MARRRPFMVVILTVGTLGLYSLYWFHATCKELAAVDDRVRPVAWTAGLLVPPVNAVVIWRYAVVVEDVTGRSALLVVGLWLVFFPAAQYVVQRGLNDAAADVSNPVPP